VASLRDEGSFLTWFKAPRQNAFGNHLLDLRLKRALGGAVQKKCFDGQCHVIWPYRRNNLALF
jgi:hypothetical protein